MPKVIIEISESMEARIVDAIQKRRDFVIDGGRVFDGEKNVFLKSIRFSFHESESSEQVEKAIVKGA